MNKISFLALCWLIFVAAFIGGLVVYDTKSWPYGLYIAIKEFIQGHPSEDLSLREKIINDLNLKPTRHIKSGVGEKTHLSDSAELEGLPFHPRRKMNPTVYLSEHAVEGYRVIYGIFDFEDAMHGAVLLDPKGRVVKIWKTSQEDLEWEGRSDVNIFPHGFEIAPDGSIVNAYDSGSSLTKYDYCNNIVWRMQGQFHHSIAFEGNDLVWVWQSTPGQGRWGHRLTQVDYATGESLQDIHMVDVVKANRDIDIFGIRQLDTVEKSTWVDEGGGRWHPNDIDPLPEELAVYYPQFEAGDLLVSLRSPNLVFVMDPETKRVKWWRQGLTRRQHDPDWNDRGTITIFNNNMHQKHSHIVEIDPVTYQHQTILDGGSYDFYAREKGKHQPLPGQGISVTSSDNGRVFEIDGEGRMTFEFINRFSDNGKVLAVSEARVLPEDFFKELPNCD